MPLLLLLLLLLQASSLSASWSCSCCYWCRHSLPALGCALEPCAGSVWSYTSSVVLLASGIRTTDPSEVISTSSALL
jgi:hypothetical protein